MRFQPCPDLQAFSWKNYEQSCLNVNIKNHSQYPVLEEWKTQSYAHTVFNTRCEYWKSILSIKYLYGAYYMKVKTAHY